MPLFDIGHGVTCATVAQTQADTSWFVFAPNRWLICLCLYITYIHIIYMCWPSAIYGIAFNYYSVQLYNLNSAVGEHRHGWSGNRSALCNFEIRDGTWQSSDHIAKQIYLYTFVHCKPVNSAFSATGCMPQCIFAFQCIDGQI